MFLTSKEQCRDLINKAQGWNKKQLAVFGIDYPPMSGWKKKLIENYSSISCSQMEEFLRLKSAAKKKTHSHMKFELVKCSTGLKLMKCSTGPKLYQNPVQEMLDE